MLIETEDIFLTVKNESEGIFKDKGSKFIAFAFQVYSEDSIKEIISDIRKKHFSARHVCWAYRLGAKKQNFRVNDDGEPSNSAGKPILGQIQAHNLSNILIVVVRYFGGTLLGVGGLIQAYKEAAADALKNAEIISLYELKEMKISFNYIDMNTIMKIIKDYELKIVHQDFDNECTITLSVRTGLIQKLTEIFKENNATNHTF
ncbi:MAG: YigZ family protein [Bacteroidales bacterium]|nr:YigZ family protein [Bacteroidales bacterium]